MPSPLSINERYQLSSNSIINNSINEYLNIHAIINKNRSKSVVVFVTILAVVDVDLLLLNKTIDY